MAQPGDYEWIDGPEVSGSLEVGLSVILIKGAQEDAVRDRLGMTQPIDPSEVSEGTPTAALHATPTGVVVIEEAGYLGEVGPVVESLSTGTAAVGITHTFESSRKFAYARDGEVLCAFDIDEPLDRTGSDPHVIERDFEDLGYPTFERYEHFGERTEEEEEEARLDDEELALRCALALGTRLTGVWLTEEQMTSEAPVYSTDHLYPMEA